MIRPALQAVAFALLIAVDIALGLSLPTTNHNASPGAWRDHRAAWAYMRLDNNAWLRAMYRAITAPMFVGSEEPPPDTPDDSVEKNSELSENPTDPPEHEPLKRQNAAR